MDVLVLSRLQFALTVMFHYLFPPLTIGLGAVLAILLFLRLRTGEPIYESAARFWTKIFAANFSLGVATGIVMEFQFGTNWASYSRFVGDVFGSALAAEGIFAFFLESGFLAVLVFGWDRVSPRMHFIAGSMVALGSAFSAVWIVVANSWQQTPAGHHLVTHNGVTRAEIVDFWAMVFNPSSVIRLTHVLIAAVILGAFCVMSIAAWYLLKGRHEEFARRSFDVALPVAFVFSWLALVSGHVHAEVVAEHQPAKLAAYEAHFTTGPADMSLIGFPNVDTGRIDYNIAIPGGLSFLVHGDPAAPVRGLNDFPREDWPPVAGAYASYHLMIGIGSFFIAITTVGVLLRLRKRLYTTRPVLWVYVFAVLLAYVANQAGWVAAEVGRQPWTVFGLLRTKDSLSTSVVAGQVLTSIIAFGLVYLGLFAVWIYIMNEKIQHGPEPVSSGSPTTTPPSSLLDIAAEREGLSASMLDSPRT